MEVENKGSTKAEQICARIMCTDEYRRYFTIGHEGIFPEIKAQDDWEAMLLGEVEEECIGIKAKDKEGLRLPSVLFESMGNGRETSKSNLFNTERSLPARVLEHTLDRDKGEGIKQCFSGRVVFNKPDLEEYLHHKAREKEEEQKKKEEEELKKTGLITGRLKAIFSKGGIKLYWDEKEITKGLGIHTAVLCEGRWYDSGQAKWEIEKESEHTLIARGKWQRIGLVQAWKLKINKKSELFWNVDMEAGEEVKPRECQVNIMVTNKYKKWFCVEECSNFTDKPVEDEYWHAVFNKEKLSKFIGVVKYETESGYMPSIVMEYSEKERIDISRIFNAPYQKARILQYASFIKMKRSTDNQRIFSGRIIIGKNIEEYLAKADTATRIASKATTLVFDSGRGRFFYKGREITKKLCMYTSLRSVYGWHDSSQAIWEVTKASDTKLIAKGKWRYFPISQLWEIEFQSKGIFTWSVTMEVFEKITIDREQANVMLSSEYNKWIVTGKEKGVFPEQFEEDISDDWSRLWMGSTDNKIGVVKQIGEEEKILPAVTFRSHLKDQKYKMAIVNSDAFFQGRLLQCLRMNRGELCPGEFSYFAGEIIIANP